MATVNEKMTILADAIREKTGTTEPLSLDQMAIEVMTIENNGEATEQPAYLDKVGLQRMWYNLSNRVNDKFMSTTIRQLGTDWYAGDGTQSSLICVHVAFADWSQETRNAFLIPNKRYPVFWGGQTYLSYAKPYGNSAYLGNPALALDDDLKQLDDNGEDFCIYRYNDPSDPSSPYLMMIHRNIPLGSYPLKLYYPISENVVDLDLEFEGAAADAKAVGDALAQIESKIDDVRPITNEEVDAIFSAAGLILPAAEEVGF